MVKVIINLNEEDLDNILVSYLKELVDGLDDDIYMLKDKRFIEPHDRENLKDYKKQRKAMRKVIKYFSTDAE